MFWPIIHRTCFWNLSSGDIVGGRVGGVSGMLTTGVFGGFVGGGL